MVPEVRSTAVLCAVPVQASAERSIRQVVTRDVTARGIQQAALVAMDGEGRIRAFVGGADYTESQYNRASDSRRQAGSAFKPFVYLTAMEIGRTPEDKMVDEPVTIGDWVPRNYTGKYLGEITLKTALAQSVNTVAARLANEVGTNNVAATAKRLGISSPIQTGPSIALGAVEVSPLEMAQAYSPFANGGFAVKGYGIERIRTAAGKILYDHNVARPKRVQVIAGPALPEMTSMMREVLVSGTGTRAKIGGYDLAGKTGTTSDYRDAWFVGFTGGFTTAVWVGRDDNTPMKKVTGGGAPAEIWRDFMAAALPRLNVKPIPGDAQVAVDPIGDLLNSTTPETETPVEGAPAAAPAPAATPAPAPPAIAAKPAASDASKAAPAPVR
jgi:penicillin-binding protein 1A